MPVNFIKERKRQKYLVPITIGITGIAFVILWFGYFREKEVPVPVVSGPGATKIEINFKTLENPFLKEIQLFPKTPAPDTEKGRENPFLPY